MTLRHSIYFLLRLSFLTLLVACGSGGGGPNSTTINDHAFAAAIQNDGKIVAVGDSHDGSFRWSFALMRYNSNGSLDTSFGTGGKVQTAVGGGARAVAIQSDGKIVAAGYNYDTYEFVLMRYNSNGSLDTSFGTNGKVQPIIGQIGAVLAITIQSDGKIVAAGYSYNGIGNDFAITRYNGNGTLDTTFGSGGIVITKTTAYLITGSEATSVNMQADGKIVTAGGSYIIRYNSNGSLDTSFGVGGEVLTGSYYEMTSGVAIQADNRILAAGSAYNGSGSYGFALTRYYSDGSPDTTFAGSGRVVTPVTGLYSFSLSTVVQDSVSGKIVAAGYSQFESVITRYNSDGTPDTSFASGGKIITTGYDYWGGINSSIHHIAVQADGKIVVVGSSYKENGKGDEFGLARHNSNGSIDTSFGTNGTVISGF
jgi:uncharacterized delta-60 repeat protein